MDISIQKFTPFGGWTIGLEITFLCMPVIPKLLKTLLHFVLLIWKWDICKSGMV